MPEGIVYILTNPAMPGIVKIGKTTREMDARLNELYSTGVPLPFECAYAARVGDETQVERAFHQAFGPYRVNPKREFFNIEPEQAIALLELMAQEDLTPAIQREAENVDRDANASAERFKRQRRPPLNYIEMGIPIGSTLLYEGDGVTTCTVSDGRHVEYQGQIYSISKLTAVLRNMPGRPIRGSSHWSFTDACSTPFMRTLTSSIKIIVHLTRPARIPLQATHATGANTSTSNRSTTAARLFRPHSSLSCST